MDRRVQEFRRGAARLESKTTGRPYPSPLRELAVSSAREHVAAGGAVSSAAASLEVPPQTLTYWLSKASGCTALSRVEMARDDDARETGYALPEVAIEAATVFERLFA